MLHSQVLLVRRCVQCSVADEPMIDDAAHILEFDLENLELNEM